MRLKRLIVHGFKSFADRTTIDFEGRGVTCIVGPNGCGKSNVIDAVKWILGEQRPTSLRGKEMVDVIFNGTVRRAPMGLCEGTLVFDNASGTLPTDETEVTVTRRVFRSGETEYQINGRSARLKDIRDLFAGTGIGYGGYGFMEQGKIDSVLDSNPLERRRVFEEAAGISRFRTRRRETELKLARVEDNLTRLADIVEEVSKQIRSLKIHAGKARSHREMTARIRELQIGLNRHRYLEFTRERDEVAGRLEALAESRQALEERRDGLREEVRGVEAELQELMAAVADARERHARTAGDINGLKEKVRLHMGYRTELDERLSNREAEIRLLEEKLARTREEQVLNVRELEDVERDAAHLAEVRGRREADVSGQRKRTSELQEQAREAEAALRKLEQETHEVERVEARLEAEREHLSDRIRGLEQRAREIDERRAALKSQLEEETGRQESHTSALEARRADLSREELRADELEDAYLRASDALSEKDSERSRAAGRLEILQGLLEKREGIDEGARALLEEKERDPAFLPGFRGLLLDLFEVDMAHADAVQRVLGELASALVVDDLDDVRAGMAFLERNGIGGAVFLPLARFAAEEPSDLPGLRAADDSCARLLGGLLRGLEVVSGEELEARITHGRDLGPLLVTTDGALVREGRIVILSRREGAQGGLVVLQAERRDLERRLPEIVTRVEVARAEAARLRAMRDACRGRVKELSVALVEEEGRAARLDQEIMRLVREVERLDADLESVHEELQSARQRSSRCSDEQAENARLRRVQEGLLKEAAEEVARRRLALEEQTRELARVSEELEEARIEESRLREREGGLRARDEDLKRAIQECEERLARAHEEVEELHENQERMTATLAEEEAELARLYAEEARGEEAVRERDAQAAEVRERMQGLVKTLDEVEYELAGVIDDLSLARGREGELKAVLESLVERTREDLDMDVKTLAAQPVPEDEGETDWKAVETEVRELRNKIARLGNVNLAAVEELAAAEERAEFLFRERDDLGRSREQLRKVLKEIETKSTAMFMETFTAVQEHFSGIFRSLFGGGKAQLLLEDPEHPLESGIEIKARPPGKELRSITLLSGGERTMTAVALLFAIFRSNPAPCAFLDEVDAALDEDNTERFCGMLDEFIGQSQFIIVTHSRRTMERADLLLGVTMPERGVSRPVAVTLEQVAEDGKISGDAAPSGSEASSGDEASGAPLSLRTEVAAAARRAPQTPEGEKAAEATQ